MIAETIRTKCGREEEQFLLNLDGQSFDEKTPRWNYSTGDPVESKRRKNPREKPPAPGCEKPTENPEEKHRIEAWDNTVELRWKDGEWWPYTLLDSGKWANQCGGMGVDLECAKGRVMTALRYGWRDEWEEQYGEIHLDDARDMAAYRVDLGCGGTPQIWWRVQTGDGGNYPVPVATAEEAFASVAADIAEVALAAVKTHADLPGALEKIHHMETGEEKERLLDRFFFRTRELGREEVNTATVSTRGYPL